MKEIAVGIDLGTTNSSISTCWPEGHPRLVRDDDGSGIIPSVVSFTEKGDIIVGQKARQRMLVDMENTFYSLKRFIGRDMRKQENKWAASQYPFTIEEGPNGAPVAVTRAKRFPLHQVSGFILSHLIEMSSNSSGQQVKKAVITVPANFNESQRKATKQAGESAGLEVLRIFNEPTAAALAYGLGKTDKEIVAIYDFGGGTFDITILRLEDPVFEVLSTAGDTMLGGDDFDRLILEDMLAQFQNQFGFKPEGDSNTIQRFLFGAERMKCQLSDWIVTAFEDRHVKNQERKPLSPFHYEMNRDKFRAITLKLADRSIDVCKEALAMASLKTNQITHVVLVGGTTRIPYLRKTVEDFFGRPPLDKIQPDVVVSIGASIQAFSLAGGDMVYPASEMEMLPTVATRRLLPRAKGISEFETEFDEQLDLSDEVEMMEEPPPVGEEERISLPKAFEDGIQTAVQTQRQKEEFLRRFVQDQDRKATPKAGLKPPELDDEEAQAPEVPPGQDLPAPKPGGAAFGGDEPFEFAINSQISQKKTPAVGQAAPTPRAPKKTDALFGQQPHKSSPTLLDALKKKAAAKAGEGDLPAPKAKATEPLYEMGAAAAGAAVASGSEDLDALLESSEIPDMQVVAPQAKASVPQVSRRLMSLDSLDEPPLQPVTPESLDQPYVPMDVVRQMQAIHERELKEEQGEIASVGPSSKEAEVPAVKPKGTHAPLLLDVTPSTLGVGTVGGFMEIIIKKNSPVPVEKGHIFTTSADNQEKVVVRILEGESKRADENNELGVIELLDIRPAPRGEIKIEVSFDISVDGILEISAKNLETRKEQKAKLTLFGT